MRLSKLAIFYGIFCIPGAIIPWYFNLQHSFATGSLLSPIELIAGGFVTPLASSLTSDFLIGTTPALIWMVVESEEAENASRLVVHRTEFSDRLRFCLPAFLDVVRVENAIT